MNDLNKFNNRSYKLSTLSNSDLYSICIKLKLKLNGIYMKDEIPTDLNSYENGSHWTCFIKDKNNVYYYDSFGVVMPQNAYDIFVKNVDDIFYVDKNDQFLDSTSCGWWCIAFLYFMNTTKGNMLDRMKKFDNKKTIDNEIELKKYIDKIYFK